MKELLWGQSTISRYGCSAEGPHRGTLPLTFSVTALIYVAPLDIIICKYISSIIIIIVAFVTGHGSFSEWKSAFPICVAYDWHVFPSVSDGAVSGFHFYAFFADVIDLVPVILSLHL
jgi:hypothetical protein